MPPLEIILNYIFGSTTLVSIYIAWKSRNADVKKSEAQATQEEIKGKKDLADLEREIYERVLNELNNHLLTRDKEINTLQEIVNDLKKQVEDYKTICDKCQFRNEQKTKKC